MPTERGWRSPGGRSMGRGGYRSDPGEALGGGGSRIRAAGEVENTGGIREGGSRPGGSRARESRAEGSRAGRSTVRGLGPQRVSEARLRQQPRQVLHQVPLLLDLPQQLLPEAVDGPCLGLGLRDAHCQDKALDRWGSKISPIPPSSSPKSLRKRLLGAFSVWHWQTTLSPPSRGGSGPLL